MQSELGMDSPRISLVKLVKLFSSLMVFEQDVNVFNYKKLKK